MEGTDKAVQAELDKNDGVKKPPRKPRPSEIAAKKAKKKGAPKRTKQKKKMVRKSKPAKRKPGKSRVRPTVERCERLELRLTKAEKGKLAARAKKTDGTLTSVITKAIGRFR